VSDTKLELFSLNYKHYARIRGSVIISVRERRFQGMNVPPIELSFLGNESSQVGKFHESFIRGPRPKGLNIEAAD